MGSNLSVCDILAVLYLDVLQYRTDDLRWIERDRLVMSKGHAAASLYAVLAESGFFPVSELVEFCRDGARLAGHVHHHVPGVEVSTGSLGHGLSIGCGLAKSAQHQQSSRRVFVLLSDGECNEGSVWEAVMFAAHHQLENLVAIVDVNGWQSFGRTSEVMDLHPLADKWQAFRWQVDTVDGHDHAQLREVLSRSSGGGPRVVLAQTVKGSGISFMEDRLEWHYRSPSDAELQAAIDELEREAT